MHAQQHRLGRNTHYVHLLSVISSSRPPFHSSSLSSLFFISLLRDKTRSIYCTSTTTISSTSGRRRRRRTTTIVVMAPPLVPYNAKQRLMDALDTDHFQQKRLARAKIKNKNNNRPRQIDKTDAAAVGDKDCAVSRQRIKRTQVAAAAAATTGKHHFLVASDTKGEQGQTNEGAFPTSGRGG